MEDESKIEVVSEEEGDMPFVPPLPLTEGVFTSPLVNPSLIENTSPSELKVEPRSPSPVISDNIDIPDNVLELPDNLPRTKRVYVRKPLPPPREREGTRQAFDVALKTLSGTLKRKK